MNALYFALGVAFAGAVSLAREWIIERKRWQREDEQMERAIQREDTAYDRVTRAARRLVADELDTASRDLALMLAKGVWPVATFVRQAVFLSGDEWQRSKDRLAEAVDDENTWLVLASFYYSLGRLRALELTAQPGTPLTTDEREKLRSMHDQAFVLNGVLSESIPLPDNWREQLAAVRDAGNLPDTRPET